MSSQANPSSPDEEDISKFTSHSKVYVIIGVLLLVVASLVSMALQHQEPTPPPKPVHSGPPTLVLEPSAMVPGPMQSPRPLKDGDAVRSDEAVIFRANVNGTGYVLLAIELKNGQLVPFYGLGKKTPITDSMLLSEDQAAIGYPVLRHKDQVVNFVAMLSLTPILDAPERVPSELRRFPDPSTLKGAPGPGAAPGITVAPAIPETTIVAWDRISLSVTMPIPPPPQTPL